MEFNEYVDDLDTYKLGKSLIQIADKLDMRPQDIIKLDSNENPYGTPKEALLEMNRAMWECSVYPDDAMVDLKKVLAKHYNVKSSNIILGTGRNQVIDMAMRAKCSPGNKILSAATSSVLYQIYAERVGAEMLYTASDTHVVDEFVERYKEVKPEIIFLSLPNNLLGDCLDAEQVYEILGEIDQNTLVVLDGAFQEYAAFKDKAKEIKPSEMLKRHENILYLGTFSKIYGLAGMRVGFGIASEEAVEALNKFRPPYNIATLSMYAAIAAVKEQDYINECLKKNFQEMERFEEFAKESSLPFLPSYANFLTMPLNVYNSSRVAEGLMKQGVLVFDLKRHDVNAIRVTIGKPAQNDIFFERFAKYMRR